MATANKFISFFIFVLIATSATYAQQNNRTTKAQLPEVTVTAFASSDRVRFASPSSIVQVRLEVYDAMGTKLFDYELRGGNVLDWHFQNGQAERLADHIYLCVVTLKNSSGRITQKIGSVTIEKNVASVRPASVSQMTAQQAEAIGPLEGDSSLSVLGADEPKSGTVIAHNGEDGQIIRGKGALSFRLGDYLRGKDIEQMRLTEGGHLGIGITNPQARLDVDGLIRATQGIVFPDGSIQFSAARKTFGATSQRPGRFEKNPFADREDFEPQAAGTGTQNYIAKWAETGGAGTLTNSAIYESAGNIGIGTTSPQYGLEFRGNNSAAAFTRDLGTLSVPVPQSVLQLGVTNAASRAAGIGPSFLFFGDNSAGTKSFLGRVSGVWENPAAGAEAGAIFFQVRANSGDTTASTERMRITAAGKVGIGTTDPLAKLHVDGGSDNAVAGFSNSIGVQGSSFSGYGVAGDSVSGTAVSGVSGIGPGVMGESGTGTAVWGHSSFTGTGVKGESSDGTGVYGSSATSWAGYFSGKVHISGSVGIGTTNPNGKLEVDSGPLVGIYGKSTDATGVLGESGATGIGVAGTSTNGTGVYGNSSSGWAGRFTGKVKVSGGDLFIAQPNSLVITSPNGSCWHIRVNDAGTLFAASIPCP